MVEYERKQVEKWLNEIKHVTAQYSDSLTSQTITSMNGIISFYNEDTLINNFSEIENMINDGLTPIGLNPLKPITE